MVSSPQAALLQGYKPASSRSPTTRHVELAQLCTGSEHERRWLGAVLVLGAQRLVEVQAGLRGSVGCPGFLWCVGYRTGGGFGCVTVFV